MSWPLLSLRTGTARPFGARFVPSAIDKQPVAEAVFLGLTGFEPDQQGDPHHHGGPEKAVHHYASEHYRIWKNELATVPGVKNLEIGGFGENLSTLGLTEANVAVGDIFRLGAAVIQVSQPRQPCWKLNLRFNVSDMALRVQTASRTGWYYRVIEPGAVDPADALARIERPSPAWTLERVLNVLYHDRMNEKELTQLAVLPSLAGKMRALAAGRLSHHTVEDWRRRLDGAI